MGSFQKLRDSCLKKGVLYEDPEFPASPKSVYYSKKDSSIVWKRPTELCKNPKLSTDGATRFDLDQGALGDCWYVASVATLATRPELLARVLPKDQGFDQNYAGIFHFYFWRYGEWKDVVIDDRLPTHLGTRLMFCSNRQDSNEFWSSLMEKAYAKLFGSYEALDGGMMEDALVDFTGGIGQRYDLTNPSKLPPKFYDLVYHFYQMNSLMGSCIFASKDTKEDQLPNGLIIGHAYSITKMAKIRQGKQEIDLIRLRNPWGEQEWNGAWSDKSKEWNSIDPKTRQSLGLVYDDDGEFWMDFKDWMSSYQQMQACHLPPDNQIKHKRAWQMTSHSGSWVKGVSAGGCGNPPDQKLYWTNPQYALTVTYPDADDPEGKCWVVVALMQEHGRAMRTKLKTDNAELPISFDMYKVKKGAPDMLEGESDYTRHALELTKRGSDYNYFRETTVVFRLDPGTYVVIPSTFKANSERTFLLRVSSEQKPHSTEIDQPSGPIVAPKPEIKDRLKVLFQKYAGSDKVVDASELQSILNEGFADDVGAHNQFNTESSRSLIAMMDRNRSGVLEMDELKQLWSELNVWQGCFKQFDHNKSGYAEVNELKSIFKSVGYHLSRRVLESIVRRYGGKDGRLTFTDFVIVMCKAVSLINAFARMNPNGLKGKVEMSLDDLLAMSLFF